MAKVAISCVHGVVDKKFLQSGRSGSLIVRSMDEIKERLVYDCYVNETEVTAYRARPNPTLSEPLNPFCSDCAANFVSRLVKTLGFTLIGADQELCNLRDGVVYKLNHDLHLDDHGVDYYTYNVTSLREYWTTDIQDLVAWIEEEDIEGAQRYRDFNAALKTLERVEDDKLLEDHDDCSVCLEGMLPAANATDQDGVFILPCQHAFHNTCIRKWLFRCNFSCPLCRFKLQLQYS